MRYKVLGVLLGLAMLCHPVQVQAADAVFPRTHEIKVNEFSYEDARLLLEIAQAEAGNQGEDGMFLVMSVVLNRTRSEGWPNDIKSVIYEPFQFYTKGMGKTEISPECHQALARIEMGEVAPKIVAFETVNNKALNSYFTEVFTYRNHCFYVSKQ